MGKNENIETEYNFLTCASLGRIIPISSLDDGIYSTKVLGDGYAVFSDNGIIYSPVDGIIEKISNHGHSFNILSDDGLRLLIHIGKDSDCDKKVPAIPDVKENERVIQGQEICKVGCDMTKLDHECITEVVISNSDNLESFELISDMAEDIKAPVIKYKK